MACYGYKDMYSIVDRHEHLEESIEINNEINESNFVALGIAYKLV